MTVDRAAIQVKAMLITPNAELTAHAVTFNRPTRENPDGFHRLIGGTVEFGEAHSDTIRREVAEELGATIDDLTLLATIENIFSVDGEPGHEIVFVYSGRLNPEPAAHGAMLTESDGTVQPVAWRSLSDDGAGVPLYPAGVEAWVPGVVRSALMAGSHHG